MRGILTVKRTPSSSSIVPGLLLILAGAILLGAVPLLAAAQTQLAIPDASGLLSLLWIPVILVLIWLGVEVVKLKHTGLPTIAALAAAPSAMAAQAQAVEASAPVQKALTEAKTIWQTVQDDVASIRTRLTPTPFPGVGATFVDLFDVGEQYGLSGSKQGVTIDGNAVRTGADPAIALKTNVAPNTGFSRVS